MPRGAENHRCGDLFSEAPTEAMREWADQRRLTLQTRPCGADDLKGVRLVYAASENEAVNKQLADWARRLAPGSTCWMNPMSVTSSPPP